jgi:hypothetical protein
MKTLVRERECQHRNKTTAFRPVLLWGGRLNPGGGASHRGAIHFVTATGKLTKLAGTAAVFEHSSDASDNVASKLWEWK